MYAIASELTGAAINFHVYYTGSLYDVPLLAAMVWFIAAGIVARTKLHNTQSITPSDNNPAILACSTGDGGCLLHPINGGPGPSFLQTLPVAYASTGCLTIATMLVMGGLVFLKQYLLGREFICLLRESNQSFDNLNRLQTQLVHAEEKYRAIFEDAVVGIFQTTADGRPVSINRALAEMHKYASPEQFLAEVSNVVSQLFVDPSRMNDLRQILTKDGIVRGAEVQVYCSDRTKSGC